VARKVVVNVHEAKTHLSRLLDRAVAGDEVTIARAGHPIARLVPVSIPRGRPLGLDAGRLELADDFDAPLPDDVLEDFER
jgi:prevent-host-death family protein